MLKSQASAIFAAIAPVWTNSGQRFLQCIAQGDSSPIAIDIANQCLHSLKVLYTLMVEFMTDFTAENAMAVANFFQEVHGALNAFMGVKNSVAEKKHPLVPIVEKIFLRLVKLVADSQDENRYAFIPFLKPFLQFFFPLVSQPPPGDIDGFAERVIIKSIRFYANVVSSREYVDELEEFLKFQTRDGAKSNISVDTLNGARQMMTEHFTPEIVAVLARVSITRYMILTVSDLDKWDTEPEEFLHDELSDAFQYRIVAAGELLFAKLLYYKSQYVAAEVSAIVQHAVARCNVPEAKLEDLLLKDAAYYAVSLGESALSTTIDFQQMFTGQLALDAQNPDPRYRLIRRRIASIITFWTYDVPAELTATVYGTRLAISFRPPELIFVFVQSFASSFLQKRIRLFEFTVLLQSVTCLKARRWSSLPLPPMSSGLSSTLFDSCTI